MNHFWMKYKEKIITFLICVSIFLIMLSGLALISSSIMKLFGFEYDSVGSLILFFVLVTLLSFPLEVIANALPKALYELEKINRMQAVLLSIILNMTATTIGLIFIDFHMASVSATRLSIFVISLLLAIPSKDDFK